MLYCPEGAEELSPGFQPWELSGKAIRPEGARDHYWLDAMLINAFDLAPFQGSSQGGLRFPGLKPWAKILMPLRGEGLSPNIPNFAPFNPGLNLVQNQPVIVEMPSETAGTKNLSTKTKLHCGENVLSVAQQTVDSAVQV